MQDLIYIYAGNTVVFGSSVPTAWFITGALFLVAAGVRSVMLTSIAGMSLLTLYFIPMIAGW
jgi:hypothetical protein